MRQAWADILRLLSQALNLPTQIPFDQWLTQVRSIDDAERNPAGRLVKFLEEEFVSMASGTVVLDTTKSRAASQTLAASCGIGKTQVEMYVEYWRSVGHLV